MVLRGPGSIYVKGRSMDDPHLTVVTRVVHSGCTPLVCLSGVAGVHPVELGDSPKLRKNVFDCFQSSQLTPRHVQ